MCDPCVSAITLIPFVYNALMVDTRINIDPDDANAMLEAIRELAQAVEAFEERLTILDADVNDLRSDIRNIEEQADTD